MLLENWKDISLDKTVEEINREALNEDATLPKRKTWDYGQGYTRPFNKFGYQAYKTRETDTSDYISKLKFAESGKKSQRLQEGPGAGYHIYFYGIKLQNVKIDKIWEDRYGIQQADFTAEIVPGRYDWSADGYDWAIGEKNDQFDGGMDFYDAVEIKEGSTVEGVCENGYQAWGDPTSRWTEKDFIEEIQGDEYTLSELHGGGYIHSDIPDDYHMEGDNGDPIDSSDSRSGYKNSYVMTADLKLDASTINQGIYDERYYDLENDEDEDFEESQKTTGRLTERIHKIEHGNGVIGYAEPGEWQHLFFKGKPCGHITEDGEVYLCKDCPQKVYDAFSDYQLTKCSFLDSNLDSEEDDDRYEDYDLNDAAEDYAKDFEDIGLATDDRQAGQWYESKKSDKSRLREGTWSIPNTKDKAQAILDLMQKPLSSKEASKAMYNLYGDDKLFDAFYGNSSDVRYIIKHFIKNLVWEVEEYPDSWKRGNTPIVWEPEAIEILKKVATFDDKKVKDPHWIESSVSQRLDQPICYVLKNKESGEYASLDLNNDIEWTKNLGEAESFDSKDSAWDFLEDEVLPTISLYRGEEEEDWEYDERNLDYRDSLRDDTFTIEPVYRDSLNESTLKEGKTRLERKDYPHGISKFTDYEDDQVKKSYYSLPYGFRTDREDQEDWEKDLRYKDYIDYEKEASDWLDKNADAWNDSHSAYLKSVEDYENKVASLKIEAYDTEEYKNLTNELKKARRYRDYAEGHGWFKTAEQQNQKAMEIGEQIKKYVGNYVKNHLDIQNPGEEVDNYYNDFMSMYNTHRSKLDADIEARKTQFASAAEGKELYSGRDRNMDHHFYYKNGNKYRQIGSRKSMNQPYAYRGIYDYYETPDATQEFDDYDAKDIDFLEPVKDWNTRIHTRTVDSTD